MSHYKGRNCTCRLQHELSLHNTAIIKNIQNNHQKHTQYVRIGWSFLLSWKPKIGNECTSPASTSERQVVKGSGRTVRNLMPDLHTKLNFLLRLAFLLQILIADPINSNFFVSIKGQL